ncbi:hypothetical protein ACEWY4_001918 [Coilia grayii]|uniref:Myb-like domain-containing protein n=1 Tax=Coilia grayii TaxID=363190 RepID=A0ABD1KUD6_9TELE
MVPPLRLLAAAMWQVAQQRHVEHYGILEEFVTTVTESVPELLSYRQRAQLILGLRARLILELCRGKNPADVTTLQPHLDRIQAPPVNTINGEVPDEEVEESETNFLVLVQTLLKDPAERDHFFQNVFPVEYGYKYDKALQRLMLDFLSRLEQLLPVPDLTQMVSWLSRNPSSLEECLLSVPLRSQTKTLLEHHRNRGLLHSIDSLPSTGDDYILSSLSLPPLVRVVIATEQPDSVDMSDSMSAAEGLNGEDFLDFPVDLSKDDKSELKAVEFAEGADEHGPRWQGGGRDESDDSSESGDHDTRIPVALCNAQPPPPSLSPPLLDLSLKCSMTGMRNCTSEEHTLVEENQKKALNGQEFAEKRKVTEDSSDVPLKRPCESPRIRDDEKPSAECSFIYSWGGYTDLQDVPQHTANDVSKIPWSDQETLNLIDIWGKDSIQRSLKDCVHNRHIFNVISKKMLDRGYMRTAEQCHTRIKRLKMSFKQCYENNVNGGERLECKFYDQLEKILVPEGSSSVPEVTYDVQEIVVGDQPAEDQPTREANHEESELKFLGHTGLEGTKNLPWTDHETQTLINIWGEDRNGHIFSKISRKMSTFGYIRTAEQCQSRVKRLKLSFRQCYDNNHTPGKERVECKFYDQLERLLVNKLPLYAEALSTNPDTDAEAKDFGEAEHDCPVYSYQEIEAAVSATDERKKVPWSDSETLVLLELWGDEKVQRNLQRCPHNGHIYSQISEQLNAHGHSRTSEQCHTRIKRLKLSYRQCRESMRQAEHVEFKFYDLMEDILNKYPSSRKAAVNDSVSDSEKDLHVPCNPVPTDRSSSGSWSDPETLALIDIWAQDEVQRGLKGVVHNGHVFSDISQKLLDLGYSKTPEQCRWKVKTLRQNFRQCYERKKCGRDKVGYKFYDQLEQVLGYEALSIDVFDEKDDQETGTDSMKFTPWSEPETLALIDIWGNKDVQRSLRGCIRNSHIFAEISDKMAAMGYPRTAEQCHKRVTKLRKTYRRCRNSMMHGGKPVLFRYYRFLEPILGHVSFSSDSGDLSLDVSMDTTADSDPETESQRAARMAVAESSRKMPWSDRETQALLGIWGEDRIQYNLRGCLKNRHIFKHISKRLMAQGFMRTAEQCQTRVKRLKARFYHEKEDCKFYEQLEQIFLKEISSSSLPEEPLDMSGEQESITDSEPESPASAPPRAPEGPKLPWMDSETQVLIDIWGSDAVQSSLRGCVKNKHIFAQISRAMAERGYARTAEQCQSRVKRLKASYRQCNEGLRVGGEWMECKFYDQLTKIFGKEHSTADSGSNETHVMAVKDTFGKEHSTADSGSNETHVMAVKDTFGKEHSTADSGSNETHVMAVKDTFGKEHSTADSGSNETHVMAVKDTFGKEHSTADSGSNETHVMAVKDTFGKEHSTADSGSNETHVMAVKDTFGKEHSTADSGSNETHVMAVKDTFGKEHSTADSGSNETHVMAVKDTFGKEHSTADSGSNETHVMAVKDTFGKEHSTADSGSNETHVMAVKDTFGKEHSTADSGSNETHVMAVKDTFGKEHSTADSGSNETHVMAVKDTFGKERSTVEAVSSDAHLMAVEEADAGPALELTDEDKEESVRPDLPRASSVSTKASPDTVSGAKAPEEDVKSLSLGCDDQTRDKGGREQAHMHLRRPRRSVRETRGSRNKSQ